MNRIFGAHTLRFVMTCLARRGDLEQGILSALLAAGQKSGSSFALPTGQSGYAVIELAPLEAEAVAEVISAAQSFFGLSPIEKAKCRLGPAAGPALWNRVFKFA
jgi:hypothetical protein